MNLLGLPIHDSRFRWAILSSLLILIYLPILLAHTTVNPDAQMILENISGFSSLTDYLQGLITYKTLDFQPVRDLSLKLDLVMYELFDVNTIIKVNLLIWIFSLTILFDILKRIFPLFSDTFLFMIVLTFAVNPLFSTSICWGMARKHLLSFFFILIAVREATSGHRSPGKILLAYVLSVLSQPISLLWPLWLISYDHITKRFNRKNLWLYVMLLVLMAGAILINTFYYRDSTVYHEIYSAKGEDLFNLLARIQVVAHYCFQLLLPYWLVFENEIGGISTYMGLILLLALVLLIYKSKIDKNIVLTWCLFVFLPLAIVSTDSILLSDTYLLIPAAGMLIIITLIVQQQAIKISPVQFWILIILWGTFTFQQTFNWKDNMAFAENSFEKAPNCSSAMLFGRMNYLEKESIPQELKNYLISHHCVGQHIKLESKFRENENLTMLSYMTYYEPDFNDEQKRQKLTILSRTHYLPRFFLAAMEIKQQNFTAADLMIQTVIGSAARDLRQTYEPIVAKVLLPYCIHQNKDCASFMKYFAHESQNLYYE